MAALKKARRWSNDGDVSSRRDTIMKSLNVVMRRQKQPGVLRMQDVADHLGLVKGNLYYYFKNKEDLIYHCHVKSVEVSLAALERARAAEGTPGVRLHALLTEHILALTEGDYSGVLLADMEHMSAPRRRHYVKMRDAFEAGVRDLIAEGIACGEFEKQDARLAGFAMLGAINWIPKWYRPDGELRPQEIARSYSDMFLRMLMKGEHPR